MERNLPDILKQIVPLMQNSLIPALILYAALTVFPYRNTRLIRKRAALPASRLFMVMLRLCRHSDFFNHNRPLFFILVLMIAYMLINYLKYAHGIIYNLSVDYFNLCFSRRSA